MSTRNVRWWSVCWQCLVVTCFLNHAASAVHIRGRRVCYNTDLEPFDEGVYFEPMQRSRLELLLEQRAPSQLVMCKFQHRYVIKFEFRTTSDSGVLLYGRSRQAGGKELLALRLQGGDLYYSMQCSTLAADLLFQSPSKLSDGRWHAVVVRLRHGDMSIQLQVDGVKDVKSYEKSCGQLTSLVFGGIKPDDQQIVHEILGNVSHFDGCIRRVHVPVLNMKITSKYYAVSRPGHCRSSRLYSPPYPVPISPSYPSTRPFFFTSPLFIILPS